MNVAVINLKDITKYILKIIIAVVIIYITTKNITNSGQNLNKITSKTTNKFLTECLRITIPILSITEQKEEQIIKITNLMNIELAMLEPTKVELPEENTNVKTPDIPQEEIPDTIKTTVSPQIEISKNAETQQVAEKNFEACSNLAYGTIKIDNQSDYTITQEMMVPDVEITNQKDILIYHTHTCESYTPCDTYSYTMTGNYRTTDSNYNVVRVGAELATCLINKGFNAVQDGTYHDYPSYSGSYSRSLETAERLVDEVNADIVIDLHRDAVGNGDTYGPTVMVNGQKVAQLMFVIGTDGGGLEHPNWVQNLKIAIKIQEKANEMYPGLFRPMIIRNSRYNQHVAKGASIIEVGATANTLGECLLSMQCLANVIEEVCK